MEREILRDRRGMRIGEIEERNGKLILRDAKGIRKGEYDPKSNKTRDARGMTVGEGNLLAMLLDND